MGCPIIRDKNQQLHEGEGRLWAQLANLTRKGKHSLRDSLFMQQSKE